MVLIIALVGSFAIVLSDSDTGNQNKVLAYLKPIRQGFNIKLWLDERGAFGGGSAWFGGERNTVGCEYPEDSFLEHISSGGLFIGALVDTSRVRGGEYIPLVSGVFAKGANPGTNEPLGSEMFPVTPNHPWYHTSVWNTDEPNRRGVDDDGDGGIDEDELDGEDNDGDGFIDEDYGAVSESDYYLGVTDTAVIPGLVNHTPLGIKVWQRSYAWAKTVREPILLIEYNLVNLGKRNLRKVYIGIHFNVSVGPSWVPYFWENNFSGYWPELRTAYVGNAVNRESTPLGVAVLAVPKPLEDLEFRFWWYYPFREESTIVSRIIDSLTYRWLSGKAQSGHPNIRPNQSREDLGAINFFFSFGPFEVWNQSDTLKVTLAILSGHSLEYGLDNLYDNAKHAQTLFKRKYISPVILPAPKLDIGQGDKKVTLRWGRKGDSIDSRDIWDEENNIIKFYPPDHWRRNNPPPGVSRGGRVFEGFRLYRSEDPTGTAGSFTLLHQWDVIDSIGPRYEYDVGIETTFVDSNLNTNKTYWYAVTSFGIPDLHTIDYVDWDGSVKVETLFTKSAETSVLASRKRVNIPFSVSTSVGEVKVVPNPYRVDEDYTFESGGWEGRARSWTEDKRLIKFIHLPPTCTIRIFTIAGDVITTLHHDNPTRGELSWNLISESGRAIASGVYIFTVESDLGKQMGKFVIIR